MTTTVATDRRSLSFSFSRVYIFFFFTSEVGWKKIWYFLRYFRAARAVCQYIKKKRVAFYFWFPDILKYAVCKRCFTSTRAGSLWFYKNVFQGSWNFRRIVSFVRNLRSHSNRINSRLTSCSSLFFFVPF